MTKRTLLFALAFALVTVSCGGGKAKPTAPPPTPAPTRATPPAGQANKPVVGHYVYELQAMKGTQLPPDFQRIEDITANGETVVSVSTSNKSANSVTFTRKWNSDGVTLVTSKIVANGTPTTCDYTPPIKVVPFPLKKQTIPTQSWGTVSPCIGKTDVEVVGEEEVADAKGRKWKTWKIEERTTAGALSTQVHWFSPELGLDVRDQSESPNQKTLSILRTYP